MKLTNLFENTDFRSLDYSKLIISSPVTQTKIITKIDTDLPDTEGYEKTQDKNWLYVEDTDFRIRGLIFRDMIYVAREVLAHNTDFQTFHNDIRWIGFGFSVDIVWEAMYKVIDGILPLLQLNKTSGPKFTADQLYDKFMNTDINPEQTGEEAIDDLKDVVGEFADELAEYGFTTEHIWGDSNIRQFTHLVKLMIKNIIKERV